MENEIKNNITLNTIEYKQEDIQKVIDALNTLTVKGIQNSQVIVFVADVLMNKQIKD